MLARHRHGRVGADPLGTKVPPTEGRPALLSRLARADDMSMTPPLDVLIIESHPRTATEAESVLRHAGHRTHRCYDPDSRGFPCKGLLNPHGCPIDQGVDVAVLARRRVQPSPTSLENGAICAIRAGIPVTEQGSPTLDPFEPWVNSRFDKASDIVEACEVAIARGLEPLRRSIGERVTRLLGAAGASSDALACSIERQGSRLMVRLTGPPVAERLRQAAALEVMTAVQGSGAVADPLDVTYSVGT